MLHRGIPQVAAEQDHKTRIRPLSISDLRPLRLMPTITRAPSPQDPASCLGTASSVPSGRDLYDIVSSCALTILACTWASFHPNIPLNVTSCHKWHYRIHSFFGALVAPEVSALVAMKQWCASRDLAKQYKEYGWTQTHAQFAIMGGFLYKLNRSHDDNKGAIASPYGPLKSLIGKPGKVKLLESDIWDRSKRDILTKGLVLLQVTWFIVQFFARVAYGLPLTELELATMAYAFLSFWIIYFWLEKPQNVESRIRIYADELDVNLPEKDTIPENMDIAAQPQPKGIRILYPRDMYVQMVLGAPNIDDKSPFLTPHSHHYCGDLGSHHVIPDLVAIILACGFGAIHVAAWSFHFPSAIEQVMWRIAAVMITAIPFLGIFIPAVCVYQFQGSGRYKRARAMIASLIMKKEIKASKWERLYLDWYPRVVIYWPYLYARLFLAIEMFAALRNLPPEFFQDVSWTRFIPHF